MVIDLRLDMVFKNIMISLEQIVEKTYIANFTLVITHNIYEELFYKQHQTKCS